jgi:hypothetical protein
LTITSQQASDTSSGTDAGSSGAVVPMNSGSNGHSDLETKNPLKNADVDFSISFIPRPGTPLHNLTLVEAGRMESALGLLDEHLAPAGVSHAIKIVSMVIEALNCRAPGDMALRLQAESLAAVPAPLLDKAARQVMLHHRYPDAPRPGVFLEHIEEDWQEIRQLRSWFQFCLDRYQSQQRRLA